VAGAAPEKKEGEGRSALEARDVAIVGAQWLQHEARIQNLEAEGQERQVIP
jgi:hypothetical protein